MPPPDGLGCSKPSLIASCFIYVRLQEIFMSSSGIAERLVAEADKVLYLAKNSGRNTVRSVSI